MPLACAPRRSERTSTGVGKGGTTMDATPATAPRRARDLDELGAKLMRLVSHESVAAGRAFRPSATDVIISPFAKCGTTWLQQIVHSLRTGGDLDFDDI